MKQKLTAIISRETFPEKFLIFSAIFSILQLVAVIFLIRLGGNIAPIERTQLCDGLIQPGVQSFAIGILTYLALIRIRPRDGSGNK